MRNAELQGGAPAPVPLRSIENKHQKILQKKVGVKSAKQRFGGVRFIETSGANLLLLYTLLAN